jgi:hypothetical protein
MRFPLLPLLNIAPYHFDLCRSPMIRRLLHLTVSVWFGNLPKVSGILWFSLLNKSEKNNLTLYIGRYSHTAVFTLDFRSDLVVSGINDMNNYNTLSDLIKAKTKPKPTYLVFTISMVATSEYFIRHVLN